MFYTAQETGTGNRIGNRILVMMYEGLGGSTTEQEGDKDPFPVVSLREVSCFITMKRAKDLLKIRTYPDHQCHIFKTTAVVSLCHRKSLDLCEDCLSSSAVDDILHMLYLSKTTNTTMRNYFISSSKY